MKDEPIPIAPKDIPWPLWAVLPSWKMLHAVRELDEPGADWTSGTGYTVCGRSGMLEYPGVLTRLGAKRCDHCCDSLGLPRGKGHPKNDPACRALYAAAGLLDLDSGQSIAKGTALSRFWLSLARLLLSGNDMVYKLLRSPRKFPRRRTDRMYDDVGRMIFHNLPA